MATDVVTQWGGAGQIEVEPGTRGAWFIEVLDKYNAFVRHPVFVPVGEVARVRAASVIWGPNGKVVDLPGEYQVLVTEDLVKRLPAKVKALAEKTD
jgi:hypothetical protein